jgi:hypothetical protein
MNVEFCSGSSTSSSADDGSPRMVHAHLVDLVEKEERVGLLGLLHRLDDLAGHRADIGAAVTADLGLVTHAAQRHAHEFAPGRLGDGPAERGLADAGRSDEAEDRPLQLVRRVSARRDTRRSAP